ncbi:DedA family protein [Calditerricola satsumensis]|uniref:Alkaline phosphatase n=1 Tax=Calditerricola satsumensis TaxID=373054 RepID=A0A8J3FA03_9BACI|nr:DedA family protein [Calditerricola satsumensis]GGJ90493.1 alkaline phosphatase [Calditerricola satsumensis]
MLENVLELVSHYGYLALFLILALSLIALPTPDETLITFAGFLVSQGHLAYWPAIFAAFLGTVTGMTLTYILGRYAGYALLDRYGAKFGLTRQRLALAERWFARLGKFVLPIGYYLPGVRQVLGYTAGLSRLPFRAFALYAYAGAFVWAFTFVTLGRWLGHHWQTVLDTLHRSTAWLVVGLLAAGALTWAVLRFRRPG